VNLWYISGAGMEPGADLGPLVTREAKRRVEDLISSGEDEGADVVLDGRGLVVPGYENGNFVGPTIIHHVKVGTGDCLRSVSREVLLNLSMISLNLVKR